MRSYNHRKLFLKIIIRINACISTFLLHLGLVDIIFPRAKIGKITKLDQYRIKVTYIQINLYLNVELISTDNQNQENQVRPWNQIL